MALINGIYVFIDEDGERVEQEYELSSHPVEDGEAVADHLRPQPFVIKLQGEVVGRMRRRNWQSCGSWPPPQHR